jgi:hypothetical protein
MGAGRCHISLDRTQLYVGVVEHSSWSLPCSAVSLSPQFLSSQAHRFPWFSVMGFGC